jgi:hypothetical protein
MADKLGTGKKQVLLRMDRELHAAIFADSIKQTARRGVTVTVQKLIEEFLAGKYRPEGEKRNG